MRRPGLMEAIIFGRLNDIFGWIVISVSIGVLVFQLFR